jgi:hypothetical protein
MNTCAVGLGENARKQSLSWTEIGNAVFLFGWGGGT